MKSIPFTAILLAIGICLPGCEQKGSGTDSPQQVMVLDKKSRPGRVFMYVDDQGNMIKTRHYNQIPQDKRQAVIVLEGQKRARITRAAGGDVDIQALPSLVGLKEERLEEEKARELIKAAPPEKDPPSTEKWTDEQWREELKREMQELRKEEEGSP